jgi:hypothetical protein
MAWPMGRKQEGFHRQAAQQMTYGGIRRRCGRNQIGPPITGLRQQIVNQRFDSINEQPLQLFALPSQSRLKSTDNITAEIPLRIRQTRLGQDRTIGCNQATGQGGRTQVKGETDIGSSHVLSAVINKDWG